MEFIQIYDAGVSQYAYLIGCEETRKAILVDPQRAIGRYLDIAEEKNLEIVAVSETHIHADFISGVREFLHHTDVEAYLSAYGQGEKGYSWVEKDGFGDDRVHFVKDGEKIKIGNSVTIEISHTPGHTAEHIAFLISDGDSPVPLGALTGDFIFAGDLGRPDLLERAAKQQDTMKENAGILLETMTKFKERPDSLMIWPGHGAGSACGKALGSVPYSTWGYEKINSPALNRSSDQDFVDFIVSDQKEPPLYFLRMNQANKKGMPLIFNRKQIAKLSAQEMEKLIKTQDDLLVIDTRDNRMQVMAKHVPGSFHAPYPSMSTAVGSMIEDENRPLLLVIDGDKAEEAYDRLLNIGYDNVLGYVTPQTLEIYFERSLNVATIPAVNFAHLEDVRKTADFADHAAIIDARSGSEYGEGHLDTAINAPFTRFPEARDQIPDGKKLYVHCGTGRRASIAVTYLEGQGFDVTLVNDTYGSSPCGTAVEGCDQTAATAPVKTAGGCGA